MTRKRRHGIGRVEVLVLLGLLGVAAGITAPAVLRAQQMADQERCRNNLKEIGLAMHRYADAQGGLPPRRLFSPYQGWGAILLPYVGQEELAKKYHLDKHFYDPENRCVIGTRLAIYQCPEASPGRTVTVIDMGSVNTGSTGAVGDYFVPNSILDKRIPREIGDNKTTALADDRVTLLTDFPDGLATTLLVTEQAGRPDHWIKGRKQPTNAGLSAASWWGPWASFNSFAVSGYSRDGKAMPGDCAINCNNAQGVYAFHTGGANALFADGSVRFLREGMSVGVLYATVTRGGGEVVADSEY